MGNAGTDRPAEGAPVAPHDTPTNMVMGAVEAAAVEAVVADLTAAGFTVGDVLAGEEGVRLLRATSNPPGVGGFFNRLGLSLAGDLDHLEASAAELQAGRTIVFVEIGGGRTKEQAAAVLARHGARLVTYFGRWTIEPMG